MIVIWITVRMKPQLKIAFKLMLSYGQGELLQMPWRMQNSNDNLNPGL